MITSLVYDFLWLSYSFHCTSFSEIVSQEDSFLHYFNLVKSGLYLVLSVLFVIVISYIKEGDERNVRVPPITFEQHPDVSEIWTFPRLRRYLRAAESWSIFQRALFSESAHLAACLSPRPAVSRRSFMPASRRWIYRYNAPPSTYVYARNGSPLSHCEEISNRPRQRPFHTRLHNWLFAFGRAPVKLQYISRGSRYTLSNRIATRLRASRFQWKSRGMRARSRPVPINKMI